MSGCDDTRPTIHFRAEPGRRAPVVGWQVSQVSTGIEVRDPLGRLRRWPECVLSWPSNAPQHAQTITISFTDGSSWTATAEPGETFLYVHSFGALFNWPILETSAWVDGPRRVFRFCTAKGAVDITIVPNEEREPPKEASPMRRPIYAYRIESNASDAVFLGANIEDAVACWRADDLTDECDEPDAVQLLGEVEGWPDYVTVTDEESA